MKQYLGMTTAILALGLAMPALAQDDAAQDQQTDQPQPSDQVQEEQTLDGQQAQDAEQPQQTQDFSPWRSVPVGYWSPMAMKLLTHSQPSPPKRCSTA